MSNWWEAGSSTGCIAAYAPIGAASLAASYSNLANPGTYDAAPGVAPSFNAATGWTFNGSTQYLTVTSLIPSYPITVFARFIQAGTDGGAIVSVGNDGGGVALGVGGTTFDDNGDTVIGLNASVSWAATNFAAPNGVSHVLGVTAPASGKLNFYLDGVDKGASWGGTTRLAPSGSTFIGVQDGVSRFVAVTVAAVVIYAPFSGDAAAVMAAMAALPVAAAKGLPIIAHHWRQAH